MKIPFEDTASDGGTDRQTEIVTPRIQQIRDQTLYVRSSNADSSQGIGLNQTVE